MARKAGGPVVPIDDEPEDEEVVDEVADLETAEVPEVTGEWVAPTAPNPELVNRSYPVRFALPYGVLVALLESNHADAMADRAKALGLLDSADQLTDLGKLVASGFDQIEVRHKMLAAWREQHNRGVK